MAMSEKQKGVKIMNNTRILLNIIDNIKSGQGEAVYSDCLLLPKEAGKIIWDAYELYGPELAFFKASTFFGFI